jgi:hypothetical protein
MRPTAAQRRAQHFAEFKREREQEEQERRDWVIAEFRRDPHAMAAETGAREGLSDRLIPPRPVNRHAFAQQYTRHIE